MGISADGPEESAELARGQGIPFRLLSDRGAEVAARYGARRMDEEIAVPSVFIVARDRRVHWSYVGKSTADRPSSPTILQQLDDLQALQPNHIRPPVRR